MRHNIGIYVRVSTEEQAQVADGSIENQQHRIKTYINMKKTQEKNWGKIVETYIDDGYSAKSTNRPAYQRMVRDLKAGKINLILITDLSRLSRNIADFCDLYKELGKYKANFLSIKEQFDTSTPVGEMMVFNMVNLAQFERKQTSERIAMNFHSRALRGLVNGGSPLLGYDRDPTNPGKRILNTEEAALVGEIFKMYDDGQSLSSITDFLTKDGATRKGMDSNRYRHLNDGRWTIRVIQGLLKNHAYIGQREINAKNKSEEQEYLKAWQQYQVVPAAWEPIIDAELFFRVQKRLELSRQLERRRVDEGDKRIFFVSGMIRCGHCGRALIGQSAHGRRQIHRYYGHKQLIGEKIICPVKRYSAAEIEHTLIKHLDKVVTESGYLEKIEDNIQQCLGISDKLKKNQKEITLKSIQKIDGEIEAVFKLVTNLKAGSAGSDLIQNKLEKLAEKKKELEKELGMANQQEVSLSAIASAKTVIKSNIAALKAALKKGKPHFQKRLFKSLFQQLLVTERGIQIFYELENEGSNGKPSESNSDGISIFTNGFFRQTLGFLVSNGSPVVTNGGGEGNRTLVRRTFRERVLRA